MFIFLLNHLMTSLYNCHKLLCNRLIMDELQMEQRAQLRRNDSRKQVERNLLAEMDRIQQDIELAKKSMELHNITTDTLRKEVTKFSVPDTY